MTAGYLLFLVIGKVLIFFGMKFKRDNEIKIKFLDRLLSCSLCTGWWVYSIMSWLLGYYVFEDWSPYIPILSEISAGGFSALLVYYVEMGWRAYHEVTII